MWSKFYYLILVLGTNIILIIQYFIFYVKRSVPRLDYSEQQEHIQIHNQRDQDIIVVFEKSDWEDVVVTAAKVLTIQEFRNLFSSEILAPGHEVAVENVTIFFSDLLGSTLFYERVGDAQAYGQVRKHFDFIGYWVNQNHGSIVKTIGDAVMAVFESPENGLNAALDIQSNIGDYNAELALSDRIVIKIGLHTGSAIVVNSNDRLDYFGRTVNIAARIQGLSKGGDITLGHEIMGREGVRSLLKQYNSTAVEFESELRGIENKKMLTQVILDSYR